MSAVLRTPSTSSRLAHTHTPLARSLALVSSRVVSRRTARPITRPPFTTATKPRSSTPIVGRRRSCICDEGRPRNTNKRTPHDSKLPTRPSPPSTKDTSRRKEGRKAGTLKQLHHRSESEECCTGIHCNQTS
ncbi:hypothetical protein E2C01_093726 [Portunus trituberculatus]|uniref:Uncharacterized protein n=1 Tax=Portunus trituberculatus TaxID=210409 RepID=A0A5B7JZH8_PORTR|nr:hypothetical protein [Portunus trituberculatus]